MEKPPDLPSGKIFIKLPINAGVDANQYAVTAVTARASVIHKNTFAMKVLVTGRVWVDWYSWLIMLKPLWF
jgi:hypothetical protein